MAEPSVSVASALKRPAKPKAAAPAKRAAKPKPETIPADAVIPPEPPLVTALADEADLPKKKAKKAKKDKKAKKAKKKNKEAVLLRFEGEQLAVIDQRAESLGLSRAAWVRMVVAQVLAG
ncbi:MAG: hypothetical protein ACM31L_10660 [Actinomycetota bacterium]